jgi:cell division protein FtsW
MNRTDLQKKGHHKPDYLFMLVVLFLVVFGLIIIASASSVQSFQNFGNNYEYFFHQLLYGALIGVVAFFVFSRIDYHKYRKIALPFFIFAVILLVAVLLGGPVVKGARRWIALGPLNFQPTEIVKLAVIFYFAAWFSKIGGDVKTWKKGFLPFVAVVAIVCGLVILQPDLGSLLVIATIATVLYYIAGAPWLHLGVMGLSAVAAIGYLIKTAEYRFARLTVFLDPSLDPKGAGYQINQALLAVGSGGLFGLGLNNSIQKHNYLPEVSTDSIFAVISEELGMARALILVALFLILAVRGYQVAKNAPDEFGRLLACGIIAWISFQAFINIGAILGILPLTGVPLPFISYGSSALIVTLAASGILLNISRQTVGRSTRNPIIHSSHSSKKI